MTERLAGRASAGSVLAKILRAHGYVIGTDYGVPYVAISPPHAWVQTDITENEKAWLDRFTEKLVDPDVQP